MLVKKWTFGKLVTGILSHQNQKDSFQTKTSFIEEERHQTAKSL
jgi:hypothetical protein